MLAYLFFWISLIVLLYSYIGYPVILALLLMVKKAFHNNSKSLPNKTPYQPAVSFIIPAYNEAAFIHRKIQNCLALNYPANKLKFIWITDGSTDNSHQILGKYPEITVFHHPERKGKMAAINRVMPFIDTEITIFSDANTMLNSNAISNLIAPFTQPETGIVAGEKRVLSTKSENAPAAGEHYYWQYESMVKYLESEVYSVIAAAGELFAIRTQLFTPMNNNTLVDDFFISINIAMRGYKIKYAPKAIASEKASISVPEELKRKFRIAAGAFQTLVTYKAILNIFKYNWLSFTFISHKVFRWIFNPLALLTLLPVNIYLILQAANPVFFYNLTFILQLLFYTAAVAGCLLQNKKINIQILFVPFYILLMHYSVFVGFIRYISGKQTVLWEKAIRKT